MAGIRITAAKTEESPGMQDGLLCIPKDSFVYVNSTLQFVFLFFLRIW